MYDVLLFLALFTGCAGCVYLEEHDRERCVPQCGEYYYTGKVQDGKCVCDMSKVKR